VESAVPVVCLSILFLLLPAHPLFSSSPSEPHRIKAEPSRVEVSLVLLDVVVTDKKGEPVRDLGADDFDLLVDDVRSPIEAVETHCAPPAEPAGGTAAGAPPRYLILFFDMSHLLAPARLRSIKTAIQFVDEMMLDRDQIMVVAFSRGLRVVNRFTSDKAALHARLESMIEDHELIDPAPFEEENTLEHMFRIENRTHRGSHPGAIGETLVRTGTIGECQTEAWRAEVDATRTLRAIANTMEAFEGIRGRKALVFISETLRSNPGGPFYAACGRSTLVEDPMLHLTVLPEIDDMVKRANSAGISFYPLHPGGISAGPTALAMEEAIDLHHSIALSTGGQPFILMNKPLQVFQQAMSDLSCHYVLAYKPPEGFREGRHTATVQLKRKGLKVRHRDSFVISKPGEASDRQMMAVLSSPGLYRDLKVESHTYNLMSAGPGRRRILVQASVPLGELTQLTIDEEIARGSLQMRGGIISPHGKLQCGFTEAIAFEGTPGAGGSSHRAGVQTICDVEDGENEIVVAARDETGGSLGAYWAKLMIRPGDDTKVPGTLLWGRPRGDVWVRHDEGGWLPSSPDDVATDPADSPLLLRPSLKMSTDESTTFTFLACAGTDIKSEGARSAPERTSLELVGPTSFTLPMRPMPGGNDQCSLMEGQISAGTLAPGSYTLTASVPPPWHAVGAPSRLLVTDEGAEAVR